ncbi:hypothetical protein JIN85_14780 [Luteolibacter pohnpeiensis]|uniref:Uncharacterized protein n=1 Tax=Luteolibacter pohnpeiensis TaxID=454153 RepID=A0A934S986_9BACT|nr:hypothetical protein [Luteolibacter pohnpeiensis]MBK1883680.1 hypothetical protein [Luteolibacter pohnpeiensis]
MSELKLKVGGVYKSREGEEVRIVHHTVGLVYSFLGDNGQAYKENGDYWFKRHSRDLIEEVTSTPKTERSVSQLNPIKDGGPAFAIHGFYVNGDVSSFGETICHNGMSLRDYFAAKALPSIYNTGVGELSEYEIAHDCYRMADAMLAAREERRGS